MPMYKGRKVSAAQRAVMQMRDKKKASSTKKSAGMKVEKRTPSQIAKGKAGVKVTGTAKKKPTTTAKKKAATGQTFAQAFAAARKKQGAGGTFTWKGKKYSTNRADDKKKTTVAKKKSPAKKSPAKKMTRMEELNQIDKVYAKNPAAKTKAGSKYRTALVKEIQSKGPGTRKSTKSTKPSVQLAKKGSKPKKA